MDSRMLMAQYSAEASYFVLSKVSIPAMGLTKPVGTGAFCPGSKAVGL
jgi:hypothetical protein